MTPEEWVEILSFLRRSGIEKINIAGGEPTLYPYLTQMCYLVKGMGFKLSIVSNGSGFSEEWLSQMENVVDWIGLSIDSSDEADEILIGRHCNGFHHLNRVVKVAEMAHRHGIKVKLNITVVKRSWMKDFHAIIEKMQPERVKCFRALTLKGANDDRPDTWSITDEEFESFKTRHSDVEDIVFEDNDDMVSSYVMFDPIGRWMVDSGYEKRFIEFDVLKRDGFDSEVNRDRYYSRNAVYEW
jgi:radical S-adenosyl methionine domain-containing protein 2